MKTIRLTKGYVALVDDVDYERVNQYRWRAAKSRTGDIIYAIRTTLKAERADRRRTSQLMHRFILGLGPASADSRFADHKNHNGLDNRRSNLRIVTNQLNSRNRLKWSRPSTSRFKGVTRRADNGKWRAGIRINGKRQNLGQYDSEEAAHAAYVAAAKQLFGEFACVGAL